MLFTIYAWFQYYDKRLQTFVQALESIQQGVEMAFTFKLNGGNTKLNWGMFEKVKESEPEPGASATAAFTSTTFAWTMGPAVQVKNSKPLQFHPPSSISITVGMDRKKSFVKSWALKRRAPMPDDLLHHEQLHFDMAALTARDAAAAAALFVAAQPTFNTAADASNALKEVMQTANDQGQPIQDAYDEAVHPEQEKGITRGPEQLRWDGFVKVAREHSRSPPQTWPNGDAMKMTLFDATP